MEALSISSRVDPRELNLSKKEISEFLEMTPDELDGVATFYNLIFRKPVGKHVILVCDSVSCWIMGYEEVRSHLLSRLGIQFGHRVERLLVEAGRASVPNQLQAAHGS